MIQVLRVVLSVLGIVTLAWALTLSYYIDWLLTNISSGLFYFITCSVLLASSVGGVLWAWDKRSIDTIFTIITAVSIMLGLNLVFNRADTAEFVSASDLVLILITCLLHNTAALVAYILTTKPVRKKH